MSQRGVGGRGSRVVQGRLVRVRAEGRSRGKSLAEECGESDRESAPTFAHAAALPTCGGSCVQTALTWT
eukprot:3342192-Rhodomonas_salina.1